MGSRLITSGNMAFFEYPQVDEPEFDLDKNGVLFIFGYNLNFAGTNIRCARRFELGLKNFKAIGDYQAAKKIIKGDIEHIITSKNIDIENCLVMGVFDN